MTAEFSAEERDFFLALADDKHLMGQQHAEWIGVCPFLEEDLAFCSIGQDELGHAAAIYEMLVGDDDAAIDELAFGRSAAEYRSSFLVEMATTDWAVAFTRHWLFDSADRLRWALLADSSILGLRELAVRVESEERYHRLHAEQMLTVLLGDETARVRIAEAVARLAPLVAAMFEPVKGESACIAAGVTAGSFADQWERFLVDIGPQLEVLEVVIEANPHGDAGGGFGQIGRTVRSADWQPLMGRMREVIDLDPLAVW